MKPKLLFLITKSNLGGAQKYVFDLATSLRSTYDVSVASGGEGKLSELLRAQHIATHTIPTLKRDITLKDEWHSFVFLYRLLRKERPNILHLNSAKAGGLGALAGRLARVPHIVFTAHAWAWNEDRSFLSRCVIGALHWLTVMLAHRTICVSHSVYDQMARLPFTKKRMRVVHPGITPLPRILPDQARAQFRAQFPRIPDRKDIPWIVTIGELHPIKGHLVALRALETVLKTYPELVYIIIGDGEERVRLQEHVRSRNLSQTVFFTGHIQDAASLLSAFDLFVLPSFSESFGYVLVEAGAAEVPVLASRVGGIPDIIESDMGTLVPPRNSALLADAIREILRSPERRHSHALALKTRVADYFTKERMIEETDTLYQDLLR